MSLFVAAAAAGKSSTAALVVVVDELVVVDRVPPDRSRVYFGAWVTLEDDDGKELRYRIVGPDEFDREPGFISIDSPVAKALLKKSRDDEVEVRRPDGVALYVITEITYDEPD